MRILSDSSAIKIEQTALVVNDYIFSLAQDLIRRPSITPKEEGCLTLLEKHLSPLGFDCERHDCNGIANLWARRGQGRPLLVFSGHVDVVPTGPTDAWRFPPFTPTLEDGFLYGRGAADMKSSIAAFVGATKDYLERTPHPKGSIGFLITCDEEARAEHGTAHMVNVLRARGERFEYCLVGEPTSEEVLGDTIKNGRRGSLTGYLRLDGVQGHVAYPHLARNPIHQVAPALAELTAEQWDQGQPPFPPTSMQVVLMQAGTGADNIIPGTVNIHFNFRYCPASPAHSLRRRVHDLLDKHGLQYHLDWLPDNRSYFTPVGRLSDALVEAILHETGRTAVLSTAGGTSDGRFLIDLSPEVVELGPRNDTIHKINECVEWNDVLTLARIYRAALQKLLT